ncbi:MAG: PLP-dependent aminotransferase family protein [Oscillospiraceae bacterium]|jgi:2-aminoadipate transaminase|nr:PLP-dependent aminotransferase family protein [Oscillospiraceae bacterium]
MDYTFSNRISGLAPSAIREILKATSLPGIIPLAAGNPAPDAFPVEEVREITAKLLAERPTDCLQYGVTEGYEPLRSFLAADCKQRLGLGEAFDTLIVTSGAQQVMDLACKALCNEGDTVLSESPSFIGSLNTFRSYGVKLRGVPMRPDGMDIDVLEELLKTEPKVRFIYTIPNYQNPTGWTASLEKRKAIYALALKYNVLILEDNPYGELRYAGEALPSIKSFDKEGIVIYAGSLSKVLSPGIRVGYTLAPAPIIAKMTVGKQASDVHTSMLSQQIVYAWLTGYDTAAHIRKIREIYTNKLNIMTDALAAYCPALHFEKPLGGLFLWCSLPAGLDAVDFASAAVAEKVAVVPGNAFAVEGDAHRDAVRLNFSTPTNEQLRQGIEILGGVLQKAGE